MKSHRAKQVAELVNQHGQMVFSTAYRILGNAEDAEDALQDVFLKLLRIWNPETVRDWGAYLRVAASRSAVDILRRNRRRLQHQSVLDEEIEDPGRQNPRSVAMQHQKATFLREALTYLSKREARVFALRYFEEFSYEEIAEEMGLRINLIGVVLHRARARLKKILVPIMLPNTRPAHLRRNPDALK